MDTTLPEAAAEVAAAADSVEAVPAPEPSAGAGSEEAKTEEEDEETALIARAQKLIARILESQSNPNPGLLHALASILEAQEARYLLQSSTPSLNSARSSHLVGKLGNLIRENDEFYEAISSKFLSENRCSISVSAASARLLLSCSSSWMYPHVFDDAVLDNIKSWVADDTLRSDNENFWKNELGVDKPTDSELLRTYSTGLLSLALAGGVPVIEDILTSGLSAKLMGYLRMRVLGNMASQKDATFTADTKHTSVAFSSRCREENRGRSRQVFDASWLDGPKGADEGLLDVVGDCERTNGTRQLVDEYWGEGDDSLRSVLTDSSSEVVGAFEGEDADVTAGDRWHSRVLVDGKPKFVERHIGTRSVWDEDLDNNVRDDLSRRRLNRGLPRSRFKGRMSEGSVEGERLLTSPSSGLQSGGSGRCPREKNQLKNEDIIKVVDTSANSNVLHYDDMFTGDEDDDRLRECKIGSSDISEMVKKAIRAAEAEARAANAPEEAIKAAGDAAAELVKSTALEAWKSLNNEEAAVLAASKAASTVVDAAGATEVSRNASDAKELFVDKNAVEAMPEEEKEEFIILDMESLARIREKYCIQCLEILGEYIEALGPILHEKGVDVCLALLQKGIDHEDNSENMALLPEVLKLICALAAHRKFAALFVDRGGMQKLLSIRRVTQTFFGLSSCLFTIGSLQGIMERVCALPCEVVRQMIELALQLLECPQDQARKNAAIFFAAAFVFRAVLDSFDAQEGLQKMLNLLQGAASVRTGGNPGTLGAPNVSLRNDRSPAEVLTAAEKQIAYHTCVALRQYFRAHLLLLVDSLRPNKSSRSMARNNPSARAAYKPLDISNEAMDAVFLLIQRDRKIGPAFVRARWPVVDKFLASNGHITLLELCQAPPVERYLHDLGQYALGVLHVITFVPYSRKLIVNAALSSNRIGMAVILDAAAGYSYPEVIHPALNVLVNLVCPPPSISNRSSLTTQGQQPASVQALSVSSENRERNTERNISDRSAPLSIQNEARDRNPESQLVEKGSAASASTTFPGSSSQTALPAMSAGVVGDRRISLGPGYGCAGLAAQLEQGYHQARDAVRANNGIKVLLNLLHPRMITPPAALDCIRALACRVLLGLARDDTITHILTKLQVGRKLSDLIRDSGSQASGSEQGRWQSELAKVAMELIAIVTNSGRASTLAATDAAAPTLRRIERAAIAAATPITYHSRELLQLIHEHLQVSGFTATASLLQKEADLTPFPCIATSAPVLHQTPVQESSVQLLWPSGRTSCGFLSHNKKVAARDEDIGAKSHLSMSSSKKKPLAFSSSFSHGKSQISSSSSKTYGVAKCSARSVESEIPSISANKIFSDPDTAFKTPISLPIKRKLVDFKELPSPSPAKRLATTDYASQSSFGQTPTYTRKNFLQTDPMGVSPLLYHTPRDSICRPAFNNLPGDNADDIHYQNASGALKTPLSQFSMLADTQPGNTERTNLDSLIVQYLKHQHRQCPAPITTLPPLSLLHPHVCPEPSRSLNAPINVTARIGTREFRKEYGGVHAHRRDRQFIYSRFRPYRPCRDDSALLTCIAFLGDSSRIATGCHSGELKIFDANCGNVLESQTCHQTPITLVQSYFSGGNQLLLSSALHDVKLWDAYSISGGPLHSFEGCKFARFSHSGTKFAALSSETSRREVLLYDVETHNVELKLPESSGHSSIIRGSAQSLVHFSPLDSMLLWNGILWDRRSSNAVHRFDQFSDFGGGGFHPAGNEVIINSEVWDLRKFTLLRTVPSLDQTVITFNGGGDVIYAILRRNLEDITSAVNTRRVRHPLFPAFRTIDALNYSDIATVQVDRCVLDFTMDPTDSFVGVIAMDDHEEMYSSARLYEIGRKRPTDDDSDPDDNGDTDDEDDENDGSEAEEDPLLGTGLDGDEDSDSDDMSNDEEVDEDVDSLDELDEDGDFNLDDADLDDGQGFLEYIAQEGDEEDSEIMESFSGSDDEGFAF